MSTTVTETAEYSNATLPTRPQDGETIYMDAGAAPQWPLWARLYNRTAHHEALLFGMMSWSGDFAVDSGGSNSSFTVRIGVIAGVNLYNASASVVKSYAGGTIGASKISGGGNLSNSTWYYVYAYNNAGSIDFEISTTEPNANRVIKSGDSTRRYLGCFKTDSAGAPLPMRKVGNLCLYRVSGMAATDMRALNAGTTTGSYATVALATWVPPHARVARLRGLLKAVAGVGGQGLAYVQSGGDSGGGSETLFTTDTAGEFGGHSFDVETDSSRQVQYQNGIANLELTLYVHGFYE